MSKQENFGFKEGKQLDSKARVLREFAKVGENYVRDDTSYHAVVNSWILFSKFLSNSHRRVEISHGNPGKLSCWNNREKQWNKIRRKGDRWFEHKTLVWALEQWWK